MHQIILGDDGNMYFTELSADKIGKLLTSQTATVGQSVSFSVSVSSALGNPDGSVDFYDTTTGVDLTPNGVPLVNGTAAR